MKSEIQSIGFPRAWGDEKIRAWLKGHDIVPLKRPHRTMGRFAWTRILEPDRTRYRYRTGSWGKGIKVRYAIPKGRKNRPLEELPAEEHTLIWLWTLAGDPKQISRLRSEFPMSARREATGRFHEIWKEHERLGLQGGELPDDYTSPLARIYLELVSAQLAPNAEQSTISLLNAALGVAINCRPPPNQGPPICTQAELAQLVGRAIESVKGARGLARWGDSLPIGEANKQKGRRNLELLTVKPGKILPVSNPAFNVREIAKQMILLEDHLIVADKRCPDCIGKHLLAIEALADEAACLDSKKSLGKLPRQLATLSRQAQKQLLSGADPCKVAQDIRAQRKKLLPLVFPYKRPRS